MILNLRTENAWISICSLEDTLLPYLDFDRDKCSHDIITAWIYLSEDFAESGNPGAIRILPMGDWNLLFIFEKINVQSYKSVV